MKRKFSILFLSLISLFSIFSFKSDKKPKEKELELWATYYYIPTLKHSENGIDLLNEKEEKTGLKLDLCDWCTACIEGTVYIKRDTTIHIFNYFGRSENIQNDCRDCEKYENYNSYEKTGKVLWQKSSRYGKGVQNFNLKPFKTIAVDPKLIPFGSVLFISEAKNTIYKDENGNRQIHDGYFFAGDTGSKIIGNHIDVFLGNTEINPFSFIKSNKKGNFNARIIRDSVLIERMKSLHQ
ncbi:3D domain-containing protein [Aureivirga sp. CE67]|uniref:3D domain-containing protein n=1 Tax=Aureivirga sp. CE67 TaxID=1788983 RepID=UPI0018C8F94C|nr:3D domain-containing protein [Aureivirga sp. CE67]